MHLPVGNEDAGHVLKPLSLFHIRSVYTVISLDGSGKQTNTSWEISCLASSWQTNCHITYFLLLPGCSHIRKRQSKMGELKCMKQIIAREDTYQVRGSVSVQLDFLLCLLTGQATAKGDEI